MDADGRGKSGCLHFSVLRGYDEISGSLISETFGMVIWFVKFVLNWMDEGRIYIVLCPSRGRGSFLEGTCLRFSAFLARTVEQH